MRWNTLSEKDFLKTVVMTQFNYFKGFNVPIKEVSIRSITPLPGYKLGYELATIRRNDYFRIKAYFNIGRSDFLNPFSLQLEQPFIDGKLGDEIFVTTGSIDSAHHLYGGYPFAWINDAEAGLPLLIQPDGMPFKLANGGFIILA